AKLFEIGSTFRFDAQGKVEEKRKLALVGGDLRELRGTIELLLSRLDANRPVNVIPANAPGFSDQSCGRIEWGGEAIGYFGKISKGVCDKLDLRSIPAAAELDVQPLLAGAQLVPQLRPLPKFPAIRRDLSLVVSEQTRFESIQQLVAQTKPANLEEVEYVG